MRRNTVLSSYITLQNNRDGENMFCEAEFKMFELKNNVRIKYNYRMNQVTNTLWNKTYVPNYKRFSNRTILDKYDANDYISFLIEKSTPFWVGRFGRTELLFIYHYLRNKYYSDNKDFNSYFNNLCNYSGFFPNDLALGEMYAEMILRQCSEMDVHGIWPLYMEDYLVSHYEKKSIITKYTSLEPYVIEADNLKHIMPWSHSLKGKTVLIIHPFDETIRKQYSEKRQDIFAKRYPTSDYILPEFKLKTLKAVQTIAGNRDERFNTWFDALNWMIEQCRNIEFDIAIIGCGAYGLPLAYEIKKMGKGAIQMCGATQLLFGIIGNRWKDNEFFSKNLFNDSWVTPNEKERIVNQNKVEDACYW